jgi:hypothetical protein
VLLVFADALCPSCHQLWPDIAEWQTELAGALTVAAICSGSDQTIEIKTMGVPVSHVLLEGGAKTAEHYGLSLKPSAVFVSTAGLIDSQSVAGAAAVRALVAERTSL